MNRKYKINSNFQVFSKIKAMNFRDRVVSPVYFGITLVLLSWVQIKLVGDLAQGLRCQPSRWPEKRIV